jgi:hypothetical protein
MELTAPIINGSSIAPTRSLFPQNIRSGIGDTPYVRVWFWLNKPKDHQAAATYIHVALEVYPTINQEGSEYISFWSAPHASHPSCHTLGAHFHSEKSIDDQVCETIAEVYYDLPLDVQKISRAFLKFKKNPHVWGSLGWHFTTRRPSFDAVGLTMHLLKEGRIFSHAPKTESGYSTILRLIGQSAALFSVFSNIAGFQIHLLARLPASNLEKYNKGMVMAIGTCAWANRACQRIGEAALKMMPFDTQGHSIEILVAAENAVKHLNRIFSQLPPAKIIILPSPRGAAALVSRDIWRISAVTCFVALGAFGLNFAGQYFTSTYDFADVERLAQKATEACARKRAAEKKSRYSGVVQNRVTHNTPRDIQSDKVVRVLS